VDDGWRGEGNGGCASERVPCVLRVLFCCIEPGRELLPSHSDRLLYGPPSLTKHLVDDACHKLRVVSLSGMKKCYFFISSPSRQFYLYIFFGKIIVFFNLNHDI
jgi:hypothetical protein